MKNSMLFTIVMLLSMVIIAQAPDPQVQDQGDTSLTLKESPLPSLNFLDVQQLKRAKWYYSIDEAMKERDKVYKLAITKQKLTEFPMEILMLPNLQILDLSGNKLSQIPEDIVKLRNLQILNLYNNRLRSLPLALKDMEGLHTLYAARNRLTEIPAWIGGVGKLRKLDVSMNYLTDYEIDRTQEMLPRCEITH